MISPGCFATHPSSSIPLKHTGKDGIKPLYTVFDTGTAETLAVSGGTSASRCYSYASRRTRRGVGAKQVQGVSEEGREGVLYFAV